VFTLQTLPACDDWFDDGFGKVVGFSLDAGVAARADQPRKLERRCRYISRPAIAEQRLSLAPKPRVNLTRFHGAFAPNRKHRARGTPACSASARVGRNGLIE
jgi:hypothetical protein